MFLVAVKTTFDGDCISQNMTIADLIHVAHIRASRGHLRYRLVWIMDNKNVSFLTVVGDIILLLIESQQIDICNNFGMVPHCVIPRQITSEIAHNSSSVAMYIHFVTMWCSSNILEVHLLHKHVTGGLIVKEDILS